jgi:hypothetical protein
MSRYASSSDPPRTITTLHVPASGRTETTVLRGIGQSLPISSRIRASSSAAVFVGLFILHPGLKSKMRGAVVGTKKRNNPLPIAAHYGLTYVQPCSCNSMTRTTPDFTTFASGMRGMSLFSAFCMFS